MLRRTLPFAFAFVKSPPAVNERMDSFQPGSDSARGTLEACKRLRCGATDCPIVIGGKEYRTDNAINRMIPSSHQQQVAKGYNATPELAQKAIDTALGAAKEWSQMPFKDRAAIFLHAAHLISTKYRHELRAATMLGQSKNPFQAEIDVIAESCDFLRFSVKYAEELYNQQPISPASGPVWNALDYRPLEGFVSVIAPFNFSAIAANLVACPALMGNVILWKPSPNAVLSNYLLYKVFEEAGLPAGVVNFMPCEPKVMTEVVNSHPELAGVAFTGSTNVFLSINKQIYSRLEEYRNIPRISGETGGKDFHLIHPTADMKMTAALTVRGAFEYQGQKCSATSRIYVPQSRWEELKGYLLELHGKLKMGQPDDFQSFMCAVIDETAFDRNKKYIDIAKADSSAYTIIAGGGCDKSEGWFIQPTIIVAKDPNAQLLREEIFGPILTVHVYDDSKPDFWSEACNLVNNATKYALTGSIFAQDRKAIRDATEKHLRYAAGNYYINDKCTGAVVGQQPFGGARASGSNDKPGSALFLTRWVSARTIKENFDHSAQVSYPHQLPDYVTL
ncbi:delta-1-pyrroline-5-carboxylate dehydrogenase, putative [Trypanosoma equiperdum]|uniref:Multifunctional fusion protein n=3 Tax=Trypanozoon TaxID=39700 RepID=Q38BS5_TRYB2|nr:delta-1-pyrroline-5-carboxylate dehydrogenase, putative [Trypanosoma brucei brucei TREU927]EAN77745.1 delta-1-pyrroline-5-carboxylate dehydrogenase, putative [Trypanosoma brucei brucei TREU927]RHW69362.1 delta-1-pyrroline-5-carboxylate dehydrogenase [Trypanosoma brucei equiperdum]SCU72393.1 delta-1-pyrroline-5-carboxylate dehydrogenase, putative [Trypanosoma equiperdum]